jgi:hypothetical protein
VLLATPRQAEPNNAILATWQYGSGRVAALTTDVGQRWATSWPASANYEKLLVQLLRWSMRSSRTDGELALSTDVRGGAIQMVVTAVDKDNEQLNYLHLSGSVVRPSGEAEDFNLEQVAPGRYVATEPAGEPGNYYLAIHDSSGDAPLRTAINIAQSAEYDRLESNEGLLSRLTEIAPKGEQAGRVIESAHGLGDVESLLAVNVFRPTEAVAHRDAIWPAVLLAASLVFLGDVVCRRVSLPMGWVQSLIGWIGWRGKAEQPADVAPMERLKRSKAAVTARLDERRNWEGESRIVPVTEGVQRSEEGAERNEERGSRSEAVEGVELIEVAEESYTGRLLAAKRRARGE